MLKAPFKTLLHQFSFGYIKYLTNEFWFINWLNLKSTFFEKLISEKINSSNIYLYKLKLVDLEMMQNKKFEKVK